MIMKSAECIQTARKAHEALRSRAAGARPNEESSTAYRALKAALDELWTDAERHTEAEQIRRVIGQLTIDAEYFAGMNEGEGFHDATEVWRQYNYLKGATDLEGSH
jgi:hypothetical protein